MDFNRPQRILGTNATLNTRQLQKNKKFTLAARGQTGNGVKFSPAGSANKACVAGARPG